jgi:nitroimidazol reductase NimA-like FMN-containing flavoprotein (pyridoxamine 5'-phosphate oxidase superfamily)
MIEILEMRDAEIYDLLRQIGYGHLACSEDEQPYVVPIYFAYDDDIFIYTTVGKKSSVMDKNPKVCLQVEKILPNSMWKSVIVMGMAHRIAEQCEREIAIEKIREQNPSLMPALAIKWSNDWIRKNVEAVYRIKISSLTGRMSSEVHIKSAGIRPRF